MNLSRKKHLVHVLLCGSLQSGLRSLACLSLLALCLPAFAAPLGWSLVWSDEFEGSSVDTSKWDPIHWLTPYNNERQAYHPDQVTVSDGNLVLTALDQPLGGKAYRSGKVESKYAQQYGRWEVRAKLPGTQGTWPAIWLLPDTSQYGWPTQGEIDILENRGNQPTLTSSAYHYGSSVATHQYVVDENKMQNGGIPENFHNEFHTYAVEWDDRLLRFFVDDVNYYTVYDSHVGGFIGNQTAPMELNLNVAVGGDFLGSAQPNGSSVWPQQMLIDYVRIYEREATPPAELLDNGSFEDQGGSLAHWSTFGNELPNVQTHHEAPALDGDSTLKLYGQFNGGLNISGVEQALTVSPGDAISASLGTFVRSADSISGTNNHVLLKFDYYKVAGGLYGSGDYLSSDQITIADGSSTNDQWLVHQLAGTVPAGAVEARLVLAFVQPNNEGGAVHIDKVSFVNNTQGAPADFNQDGVVDEEDLSLWQTGFGKATTAGYSDGDTDSDFDVDGVDFINWQRRFTSLAESSLRNIPEPSAELLSAIAFAFLFLRVQ